MNLNYLEWTREEKDRYAAQKMEAARKGNEKLQENYTKAEEDKRAAERNNSSFTNFAKTTEKDRYSAKGKNSSIPNSAKIRDVSPEEGRQFNTENSNRFSSMRRACPNSTYTREWDKGKGSGEWELQKPKGFKNYRLDDHEMSYHKSENRKSAQDERYYRKDIYRPHASSKSESTGSWNTERYDEDKNKYERTSKWIKSVQNCNLGQGNTSAGKEESSTNPKWKYDQRAMKKSYTKFDRINRSDHSSNDSDSDCHLESKKHGYMGKDNRNFQQEKTNTNPKRKIEQKAIIPRKSYTKFHRINRSDYSSTYSDSDSHSESKKHEDNKIFEHKKTATNPNRRTHKFKAASNKCFNNDDLSCVDSSNRNKPRQLKSQKLYYSDNKSSIKTGEMEQKASIPRKSYTKFDRINRSDNSSDSYSNSNSGSNHEHIKKDNFEKNHSEEKKDQAERVQESKRECNSDKEKVSIETKCAIKSVYQLKKYSERQQYGHRKVYSHNEGFIISREFTCRKKGYNEQDLKQGFQIKRSPNTNPEYNTPSSRKNELFTKQRKYDKGRSNELSDISNNVNRVMQTKKCTSDIKASGFDVVPSSNQDQKDGCGKIEHSQDGNEGWGNIVCSQGGDDGWDDIEYSQGGDDACDDIEHSQNDDGCENIKQSQDKACAWAAAGQYGIKKEPSERDSNLEKKSDYNSKEAKVFKVRNPTGSDDGGWTTLEEGEILSDLEENKEHVK